MMYLLLLQSISTTVNYNEDGTEMTVDYVKKSTTNLYKTTIDSQGNTSFKKLSSVQTVSRGSATYEVNTVLNYKLGDYINTYTQINNNETQMSVAYPGTPQLKKFDLANKSEIKLKQFFASNGFDKTPLSVGLLDVKTGIGLGVGSFTPNIGPAIGTLEIILGINNVWRANRDNTNHSTIFNYEK